MTLSSNRVINYVAPVITGTDDSSILSILVQTNAGDDSVTVRSVNRNVPVRIETGDGDDKIVVGGNGLNGANGIHGINGYARPGLNAPFGIGPLVVVGGAGRDALVADDSGDTTLGEVGNLNVFRESRRGEAQPIELGFISGLGMKLSKVSEPGIQWEGRIEFEGFEAVEVLLNKGSTLFTIGGDYDLRYKITNGSAVDTNPAFGKPSDAWAQSARRPAAEPDCDDDRWLRHLRDGPHHRRHHCRDRRGLHREARNDDIRVIGTRHNPVTRTALNAAQGILSISGSVLAQHLSIDLAKARETGYFTLKYRYEETLPIAFTADAAAIQQALRALPATKPEVSVTGSNGSFDIVFDADTTNPTMLIAEVLPFAILARGGNDTISIQELTEVLSFAGGAGEDKVYTNVILDGVTTTLANGIKVPATFDGGGDVDEFYVHLVGGSTESLINCWGGADVDKLTVYGTELPDWFLLRAGIGVDALAFMALLNEYDEEDVSRRRVERVNYNKSIENIKLETLGGDDQVYIDDTRAQVTINSGTGKDFFQIGQLYKTSRQFTDQSGVKDEDVFEDIQTTKGWLSNGISAPMTINGGDEGDTFIVFRNTDTLVLNGQAGDDTFIIQAFAIEGSKDDKRKLTELSGDAGADLIQYVVNAPVKINGGDGFDTVILIGTEFNDNFVVTSNGIYGAGLNVNFTAIELLEVDGAEGNDHFFILGTGSNFVTRIVGGLGTDLFDVSAPTPGNGVISNDLLGHSGIIVHYVTSGDPNYDGAKVVGISANVADNDEPAVVVTESDGYSRVVAMPVGVSFAPDWWDKGGVDWYQVCLTSAPMPGQVVTITVVPPDGIVLLEGSDKNSLHEARTTSGTAKGLEIPFSAGDWWIPKPIYFAVDRSIPTTAYGDLVDIGHSVQSSDTIRGGVLQGSNVTTTTEDESDQATPTIVGRLVLDSDATLPSLTNRPESFRGAYVKIVDGVGKGQSRMILKVENGDTLYLDRAWDVIPGSNSVYEIQQFAGVRVPGVRIRIYTEDRYEIVVDTSGTPDGASGGNVVVSEGRDQYSSTTTSYGTYLIKVRLSAAPSSTVSLTLTSSLTGGLAQLKYRIAGTSEWSSTLTLTFDASSTPGALHPYNVYQVIEVGAFNDAIVEGFHKADLIVHAKGAAYDTTTTLVASITDNDSPGVQITETNGSTQRDRADGDRDGAAIPGRVLRRPHEHAIWRRDGHGLSDADAYFQDRRH